MNWIVRISDTFKLLFLFLMLLFAYKPKGKWPAVCGWILLMVLLGQAGILLEEKTGSYNFLLYILNFLLWGGCFAAAAIKGKMIEKLVAVALYCSSLFCIEDIVRYGEVCFWGTVSNNLWRIVSLLFLMLVVCFLIRNAIHTERDVPRKYFIGIIVIVILSLVLFYTVHRFGIADREQFPNNAAMIELESPVALFLLISVYATYWLFSNFISLYEQNISKAAVRNRTDAEENMVRELVRLNSELRAQRHETNHHLALLDTLLKDGEVEKAKGLLAQLTADAPKDIAPVHSGNVVADAILRQFAARANEQGIQYTIEASLEQVLPLTDTELSSLLSNLLNNALEASAQVSDPMVEVKIYPTRWYLCFSVRNRANVTAVKENPELLTTKNDPEAHGYGLNVIREIAEKHEGRASFFMEEDGIFHSRVMILLSKK